MKLSPFWLSAGCAGLIAAYAAADVVELKDGSVLVGTVQRQGDTLQVVTAQGTHRVAAGEVQRIRGADELRAQWLRLAASRGERDGFGQLALARLAQEQGLATEMWQALDRAAAANAPGLDGFLQGLVGEALGADAQKPADQRARTLLRSVKGDGSARDRVALMALARTPEAGPVILADGKSEKGETRRAAVQAVARRLAQAPGTDARPMKGRPAEERFLSLRAVVDPNPVVRNEAVGAIRDLDMGRTAVRHLGPLMKHEASAVRERTAEALGAIGHPDAVEYLITSMSGGGGSSARANVQFLEHTSYIRDFDVEVAQAATIADPVVGVLSSGVVLDAQVKGVSWERIVVERRVVGSALRKIVGQDPPQDPAKWKQWWEQIKNKDAAK
jgi:hypothetical protein